ncbi:MAG: sarcosine oxidase subunit gamma, partial [Acidobacteria bacterium]|nr:sarcosine oxidase subunit gamma [Acidobacteriota bacterium]
MADGVVLTKLSACGLLNLRLPTAAAEKPGLAQVIGLALPELPCTYASVGDVVAYWLAPDEWLVAVTAGAKDETERRLRNALDGAGAVVDVSAGYVRYNLRGPATAELLMKASPYDFDRRAFGTGR